MEITPVFNDAAQGGGGEAHFAAGPESDSPGGAGHAAAETPDTETTSAEASPSPGIADEFRNVTTEPEAPGREQQESTGEGGPDIADAKAELESLEAGRPSPEPRAELKPPPHLVKIVNTETERQREARISALKAYLEFRGSGPEQALQQEHVNSLEPVL